jgi:hypothetical protein
MHEVRNCLATAHICGPVAGIQHLLHDMLHIVCQCQCRMFYALACKSARPSPRVWVPGKLYHDGIMAAAALRSALHAVPLLFMECCCMVAGCLQAMVWRYAQLCMRGQGDSAFSLLTCILVLLQFASHATRLIACHAFYHV